MSWFFATVMVLAHFNPLLPKADAYKQPDKAVLVEAYAQACQALFASDEFKDFDISPFLSQLSSLDFSKIGNSPSSDAVDKISVPKLIELYTKVCRTTKGADGKKVIDPDLTALDNYDAEFKAAREIYDEATKDLPAPVDINILKHSQAVDILSADGAVISEIYNKDERRKWVTLAELPKIIPDSFIAVEDHRFRQHNGVDQVGIIRAFAKSMMAKKRPEGASTITQQVARNVYHLDKSVSYARKLREMMLAGVLEKKYSKDQILEIYLNTVTYFGRNSWGVEKAAESYFCDLDAKGVPLPNKPKKAKDLTIPQIAYLVGLVKGPAQYQADDSRTNDRINVVLKKMADEKIIDAAPKFDFKSLGFCPFDPNHAAYFRDFIANQMGAAELQSVIAKGLPIQSTLNNRLQTVAENSLRDGLFDYDKKFGSIAWRGPLTSIAGTLDKIKNAREQLKNEIAEDQKSQTMSLADLAHKRHAEPDLPTAKAVDPAAANEPDWLEPLRQVASKYVPPVPTWFVAVATDDGFMGTIDGKKLNVSQKSVDWARGLNIGDVVFVRSLPSRAKAKNSEVEIVQSPSVNGAVIAIDPTTGEILAFVGGYNYQASQLDRVLSKRQPGSLVKPFTYMAGLQLNHQPNELLEDGPFIFPPSSNGGEKWIPNNYDGKHIEPRPLMWALENSRNCMTADLMSKVGMEPICRLTKEFGLYDVCKTDYPFILGVQETSLMQLVRAYAGIDTGALPQISYLQSPNHTRTPVRGVDAITLYQLRFLMQGVLARGTATQLSDLSSYAAGKTGTTEDQKDAWFITYTPHLVVGVYVGYDLPQDLGRGASGATVALPIAEKILRASFDTQSPYFYHAPEPFSGPPPGVVLLNTDLFTGELRTQADANTVVAPYRLKN